MNEFIINGHLSGKAISEIPIGNLAESVNTGKVYLRCATHRINLTTFSVLDIDRCVYKYRDLGPIKITDNRRRND